MGRPDLAALIAREPRVAGRLRAGWRCSQRAAIADLGDVYTLILGGNRSGKSTSGAELAVAVAQGRDHPATQEWLRLNNLPQDTVRNRGPGEVYAIALDSGDSKTYVRPKLDQFLPEGTRKRNWTGDGKADAWLPNGGHILCKSVDEGRDGFQGDAIDLAWFDEECLDWDVIEEVERGLWDRNGRMIFSMTPLSGLTPIYERFIEKTDPRAKVHYLTGLHNPHANRDRIIAAAGGMTTTRILQRLLGEFGAEEGLVYAMFVNEPPYVQRCPKIEEDWLQFGGIDFGFTHPFCYLHAVLDPKDLHLWIVAEHYATQTLLGDHAKAIKAIHARPGLYHPGVVRSGAIWADPASPQDIAELNRLGLNITPAAKGPGSVRAQIDEVKAVMMPDSRGHVHLHVDPSCVNFIREAGLYRYPKAGSAAARRDTPVDADNHAMDGARYMIHGIRAWFYPLLGSHAKQAV